MKDPAPKVDCKSPEFSTHLGENRDTMATETYGQESYRIYWQGGGSVAMAYSLDDLEKGDIQSVTFSRRVDKIREPKSLLTVE